MAEPKIACDCGAAKLLIAGYRVCTHCDGGCELRNCDICHKYNATVSRRIST